MIGLLVCTRHQQLVSPIPCSLKSPSVIHRARQFPLRAGKSKLLSQADTVDKRMPTRRVKKDQTSIFLLLMNYRHELIKGAQ